MKYKIKKIIDLVYLVDMKDHYDLCMLFLRYQEFYESPSPKFRGQRFDILDFMEWYSKKFCNDVFYYPKQWGGFNIPSRIIDEVQALGFYDKNKYDYEMIMIHNKLKVEAQGNYYLIGASSKNDQTLAHEVAHGLYYTRPEYKLGMDEILKDLPKESKKAMNDFLLGIGYAREVLNDETQAYFATGMSKNVLIPKLKSVSKPFIKFFDEFAGKSGFKRKCTKKS